MVTLDMDNPRKPRENPEKTIVDLDEAEVNNCSLSML